jgi:propanol-preferring alcohol dehydrogenase
VRRVDLVGENVTTHRVGDRVGIPWLDYTCGTCRFCGGFATHTIADARYAFPLGEDGDDVSTARCCAPA